MPFDYAQGDILLRLSLSLITLGSGLIKGSITVSGGAILRKQALALPFR
jgi:dipeptide/tripeptide permease